MCSGLHRRAVLAGLCATVLVPRLASASNLKLLTRDSWGAARATKGLVDQVPNAILIHHTAALSKPKKTLTAKMKSLQVFSQSREKLATGKIKPAWPDVPYHFVIDTFGLIAEGRDTMKKGDTNTGYDPTGYLQLALEGDFTKEKPSDAQLEATLDLVAVLVNKFELPLASVYFHNEKASTACPGGNLSVALEEKLKTFR